MQSVKVRNLSWKIILLDPLFFGHDSEKKDVQLQQNYISWAGLTSGWKDLEST